MSGDKIKVWVNENRKRVDWSLLLFLVLFLNVKLVIKVAALCFMYVKRLNFSFKFSIRQPGLPIFYLAMIIIGLVNFFFFSLYHNQHYTLLLLGGIGFWIMCILSLHQLIISVNQNSAEKIRNTVFLFFILNAAVSFINLFSIIVETGDINPYRYQGMYQKYFIGTGDYIKGITFDTSTTNAILNAFGIAYFLSKKQIIMTLLCTVVLLLTCSNFTNLLMVTCLIMLFVFRSDRDQKSMITIQLMLFAIFMANISPQNNQYTLDLVEKIFIQQPLQKGISTAIIPITQRPDSILTTDEKKYKTAKLYLDSAGQARSLAATLQAKNSGTKTSIILLAVKPDIPKINIHAPEYQHKQDSSEARFQAISFLYNLKSQSITKPDTSLRKSHLPGKLIAFQQLFQFMKNHPSELVTGTGIGNFSSKLAFRASGLKTSGSYPEQYIYIGNDFKDNHLSVYLNFIAKDSGYHSLANFPYSFYAQLLGEYGIAGVICFLLFYVLYFTTGFKTLTYGIPLLFIMAGALIVDYWFEQLSVIIMFELLILLNWREAADAKENKYV